MSRPILVIAMIFSLWPVAVVGWLGVATATYEETASTPTEQAKASGGDGGYDPSAGTGKAEIINNLGNQAQAVSRSATNSADVAAGSPDSAVADRAAKLRKKIWAWREENSSRLTSEEWDHAQSLSRLMTAVAELAKAPTPRRQRILDQQSRQVNAWVR